jgi:cyclic 2,3-diphosphoglycerate synthetase
VTDAVDADVVSVSRNLANRSALSDDLARADAEVYLVEIKAAAIDLVAEAALQRGAEVVFAENEVICAGLDEAILAVVPERAHA